MYERLTADEIQRAMLAADMARPRMEQIAESAAQASGVRIKDLLGRSHARRFAWPRQVAMWRAVADGYAKSEVGRFFNRDHTTVMHACRAVEKRMKAANIQQRDN